MNKTTDKNVKNVSIYLIFFFEDSSVVYDEEIQLDCSFLDSENREQIICDGFRIENKNFKKYKTF